jgi:phenylacetate-CoA ligase
VTVLFKDDIYPMIRFNTHDVTGCRAGASPLGLNLRRLPGFLAPSDNMVKLRGINVFPQAIAAMLADAPGYAGDYVCRLERDAAGRDVLTVAIEVHAAEPGLEVAYRELLRRKLGLEVEIELAAPRSLAPQTGIDSRQKPIRLVDKRSR